MVIPADAFLEFLSSYVTTIELDAINPLPLDDPFAINRVCEGIVSDFMEAFDITCRDSLLALLHSHIAPQLH